MVSVNGMPKQVYHSRDLKVADGEERKGAQVTVHAWGRPVLRDQAGVMVRTQRCVAFLSCALALLAVLFFCSDDIFSPAESDARRNAAACLPRRYAAGSECMFSRRLGYLLFSFS